MLNCLDFNQSKGWGSSLPQKNQSVLWASPIAVTFRLRRVYKQLRQVHGSAGLSRLPVPRQVSTNWWTSVDFVHLSPIFGEIFLPSPPVYTTHCSLFCHGAVVVALVFCLGLAPHIVFAGSASFFGLQRLGPRIGASAPCRCLASTFFCHQQVLAYVVVVSDYTTNNNNNNNSCHKRMPKQKRPMPGCRQDEEVAKLQKDLKRARQFNTDSHSKIVCLEAQLKAQLEKEKTKDRGMEEEEQHRRALQQLQRELWETKNAVNRLESKSMQQQQMLREAETAKGRLDNEVRQLRQELCLRGDGTKERQELRGCLRQAFCFMNAVLDGGRAAEHASEDLLRQGADAVVHYLELVRRHEGTDSLLEELRKALPPKNPASSSRAVSGIRIAILQYHPDKHAGAGRWIRVLCESVTKLLNTLK